MKPVELENGCWVCFVPEFFKAINYNSVYEEICNKLTQKEVTFFGKKNYLPRLTAWYGDKEYRYSGTVNAPAKMPPNILHIRNTLEKSFAHILTPGAEDVSPIFNSVLINHYRNGQDGINWHSDDESMLGPADNNVLIASVTLGQERKFVLKSKETKQKLSFMLGHGDVLFMGGQTQKYWVHKITKTSKPLEPRLNLTFRNMK